jgi:F-type H+-transporting ATPase subunit b
MRINIGMLAALLLGLFLTVPVWAVDEHPKAEGGHKTEAKVDDHGHKEESFATRAGLTRYDLGIYTLVVFFALLFILGKFAWGPAMKGLEAREAGIKKQHDDADALKVEANKALAEVQARLAKANDEIRAMLEEARRDAQAVKDQMKAEATADIQAERDRIRREIDSARDVALQDIYQQSVQLAAILSSKAVKRELTPADHSRLIEEALADLKQNVSRA